MKIAVDASALHGGGGIGRYLASILSHAMGPASAHRWSLYLRRPVRDFDGAVQRCDRLPHHSGRILSLALSQPAWLMRDQPDLYWGPAHRFPIRVPTSTARVVTIHDMCWLRAPATMRASTRRLDALLMPRALRAADRIIAVSGSTRDDLVELDPSLAPRIRVVLEAAGAAPEPEARPPFDAPYVLAVGTVEPRKNLARLIEAFARPSIPAHVHLVIAGPPGWGHEPIAALAARHAISTRVHALGAVDDATLSTLYRHALFLAMPSMHEGFGLPILEASAQGTPVLYGNNSAMPEVAGEAGLPVDAGSVDSIAAGLARLSTDAELRSNLASRARLHAAKFSWERAARETLTVFDEALHVRRSRRRAPG